MLVAIDTSTGRPGLAFHDGTEVLAEMTWGGGAHHTEQLAPALVELLARCGKKAADIQAVGVAIGPGSFTSLRVGLSFAKGLCMALHLPVVGVPTLDVVAACVPPAGKILAAVLQAGRGRLAVGWYRSTRKGWQPTQPPVGMTAEELEQCIHKPTIVCGELTADQRQLLKRRFKNVSLASPADCVRRPGVLAQIAWERWQAGRVDPAAALAPIYLHTTGVPLP